MNSEKEIESLQNSKLQFLMNIIKGDEEVLDPGTHFWCPKCNKYVKAKLVYKKEEMIKVGIEGKWIQDIKIDNVIVSACSECDEELISPLDTITLRRAYKEYFKRHVVLEDIFDALMATSTLKDEDKKAFYKMFYEKSDKTKYI